MFHMDILPRELKEEVLFKVPTVLWPICFILFFFYNRIKILLEAVTNYKVETICFILLILLSYEPDIKVASSSATCILKPSTFS